MNDLDIYQAGALGLALIFELARPIGLSDVSGLDALDTIYAPAGPDERASRVAFVIAAGGEI